MTPGQKIPTEITFSPPITVSITKNYQNDGRKLPGKKLPGEFAPATREFFLQPGNEFLQPGTFFPHMGISLHKKYSSIQIYNTDKVSL